MHSHRIVVPLDIAEFALDLPGDMTLTAAEIKNGTLIFNVLSERDFGSPVMLAVYGPTISEGEVNLAGFEPVDTLGG